MSPRAPSFKSLQPASTLSSRAKRGNLAADTRHERILRHQLWRLGLRYRKNVRTLPGKPDVVFTRARVAIFCDGDFWHGRKWPDLRRKLGEGTNASYWKVKIASNRERDQYVNEKLKQAGWRVVRLWEGDILKNPARVASKVHRVVASRLRDYVRNP